MNMILTRKYYTELSTVGELWVDGSFECYTLEDCVRLIKIWGKTAIPTGKYDLALTYSQRFGKTTPLLEDVKGFTGIRIHAGNNQEDTEGCILVGNSYTEHTPNWIGNSKNAYATLYEKIIAAMSLSERITIEIVDTKTGKLI